MESNFWKVQGIDSPVTPTLEGDIATGTVIVGAGFTGLNAALELAESGEPCVVLDAGPLGGGASGRSGGFVGARFRMPPAKVRRLYGQEMVDKLQRVSGEAMETVRSNVARYGLNHAELKNYGSITAAINERHFKRLRAGARDTRKGEFGAHAEVEILSRSEIQEVTGSPFYAGGSIARGVYGIHPWNYMCGLAAAAIAAGVTIHPDTPALGLAEKAKTVIVDTAKGRITANRVILATNGYSLLTRATHHMAGGIIPFRSACIATAPLADEQLARILPGRQMLFDTRRLLRWFRLLDGRLVIGGRGAGSPSGDEKAYAQLRRQMIEAWPELAQASIDYRWSGFVGITLDALPHVGAISEHVFMAGGYNGNGVATGSLFGRYAARKALGKPLDIGILEAAHFRRIPFARQFAPAVRLVAGGYDLLDRAGI